MSTTVVPVGLFNDGKDAGALRTIGEVATALNIRQHVLRYWEEQFPQLKPIKRSGGRRYYRPEDVALVMEIDRLVHREGYTLKGARQVFEGGAKPIAPAAQPAPTERPLPTSEPLRDWVLISKLSSIRQKLNNALQA